MEQGKTSGESDRTETRETELEKEEDDSEEKGNMGKPSQTETTAVTGEETQSGDSS